MVMRSFRKINNLENFSTDTATMHVFYQILFKLYKFIEQQLNSTEKLLSSIKKDRFPNTYTSHAINYMAPSKNNEISQIQELQGLQGLQGLKSSMSYYSSNGRLKICI